MKTTTLAGTHARYNISVWWGESKRNPDGWKLRFRNVRWWRQLADRLSRLYAEGWDDFSILVERVDHEYFAAWQTNITDVESCK